MSELYLTIVFFLIKASRLSGRASVCFIALFVTSELSAAPNLEESFFVSPTDIRYYQEEEGRKLTYSEALRLIQSGGQTVQTSTLNFGIGAPSVWLFFTVNNSNEPALRFLQIENSWLDQLNIFFLQDGQLVRAAKGGDAFDFGERSDRFFSFPHNFQNGKTQILIRIETVDPQVLPIYLYTLEDYIASKQKYGYTYGLIFGFLIALLIYNALLFFSLKSYRYLFYSLYLATFILLNAAYTGHAFQWLWPDWPIVQNTIIPVLMIAYALSGMLFARVFLNLPEKFPLLNKVFNIFGGILVGCLVVFLILGSVQGLLFTAFIGIVPFALLMISAGLVSCLKGIKEARYFLGAAIFAMISAMITAFTVSGLVEYHQLGFHAVEYGMLLEAVLFALALAYQFRINQEEKVAAERLADRDQLTGLFNRRGFDKVMEPIFNNAFRHQRELCLLVLDIDHFKKINDQHGHGYGDLVLSDLAKVLTQEVRAGDLVARWGGEEFLLLLPETNHTEAVTLAERLVLKLSNRQVEGTQQSAQYTVSIGIAELKPPITSFKQLLGDADKYLYQAKESGRNRVCYKLAIP